MNLAIYTNGVWFKANSGAILGGYGYSCMSVLVYLPAGTPVNAYVYCNTAKAYFNNSKETIFSGGRIQ
jgi:hypothetical protein